VRLGDLRRFQDDAFLVGGPEGHLNGALFLVVRVKSGSPDASWVDILVDEEVYSGWSPGGILDLSDPVS
jgi:hypothetical protein